MSEDDLARAIVKLSNPEAAVPAASFNRGVGGVDEAGLYSWWADDEARGLLGDVFGQQLPRLIYAGQAGATKRGGKESGATLWTRIACQHLAGNPRSSTFRKSLTAILLKPLDLAADVPGRLTKSGNSRVSEWILERLSVAVFAYPDRGRLLDLEDEVLARLDPPLNLEGMPPTATRATLKVLRGHLGRGTEGASIENQRLR